MMPGAFVDRQGREVEEFEAQPRCGLDMCDRCGDCLECYGDDPCPNFGDWHTWTVYPGRADSFRQEMLG